MISICISVIIIYFSPFVKSWWAKPWKHAFSRNIFCGYNTFLTEIFRYVFTGEVLLGIYLLKNISVKSWYFQFTTVRRLQHIYISQCIWHDLRNLVASGVVVKIVLPRWQKGVRGVVLGCIVWTTSRVFASKIFRFFSPMMQKAMCCG